MVKSSRKPSSKTSSFGSKTRESHDSTIFYSKKLYEGLTATDDSLDYCEMPFPEEFKNKILVKSSELMTEIPNDCIHLIVTSPPYNIGKDYDRDFTLPEHLILLKKVFSEAYRVLVPGGRACINVANLGRKPYIPLHSFLIQIMAEIGFLMRGEIIWDKSASAGTSTAWGSWQSASNPTLRDTHEYILIFSKQNFQRPKVANREDTISKKEFLEFTKSIWTFPSESAKKIGHPAPFPIELPYRCIQLYSYSSEIVLDPFMGSGQTALAALKTGRNFIGYEICTNYVALALERIAQLAQK